MNCVDLECGGGLASSAVKNYYEDNIRLSEDKEGYSCFSSSYSTANSSIHGSGSDSDSETESERVLDADRASSVVGSDCVVDIDKEVPEHTILTIFSGTEDRDCRICNLSLQDKEYGLALELGCSCKDDLAAVHQHCADTWFKIKGNNICEICHSVAENVDMPYDIESRLPTGVITAETNDAEAWQQITAALTSQAAAMQESSNLETRSFLQLTFMALVIVIVLLVVLFM